VVCEGGGNEVEGNKNQKQRTVRVVVVVVELKKKIEDVEVLGFLL